MHIQTNKERKKIQQQMKTEKLPHSIWSVGVITDTNSCGTVLTIIHICHGS